ncbi:hypothetical protein B0H14DRAFT_3903547 [Mycena olivaceomarginata]|nr:hypothetical protein B0H14DRAFT_3903547 [Mycena olivaceomarginata]
MSGERCMSLPVCLLTGPQGQSFEEVRFADYLKSYRTTGRPPPIQPAVPVRTQGACCAGPAAALHSRDTAGCSFILVSLLHRALHYLIASSDRHPPVNRSNT